MTHSEDQQQRTPLSFNGRTSRFEREDAGSNPARGANFQEIPVRVWDGVPANTVVFIDGRGQINVITGVDLSAPGRDRTVEWSFDPNTGSFEPAPPL